MAARVGLNSSSESIHTRVVVALCRPVSKLQQCEFVLFRGCGDTHMLEKRQRPSMQNRLHIQEFSSFAYSFVSCCYRNHLDDRSVALWLPWQDLLTIGITVPSHLITCVCCRLLTRDTRVRSSTLRWSQSWGSQWKRSCLPVLPLNLPASSPHLDSKQVEIT